MIAVASKEIAFRVVEEGLIPAPPKTVRKKKVEEGQITKWDRTKVHFVANPHVRNTSLCGLPIPPFYIDELTPVLSHIDCISCERCVDLFRSRS